MVVVGACPTAPSLSHGVAGTATVPPARRVAIVSSAKKLRVVNRYRCFSPLGGARCRGEGEKLGESKE